MLPLDDITVPAKMVIIPYYLLFFQRTSEFISKYRSQEEIHAGLTQIYLGWKCRFKGKVDVAAVVRRMLPLSIELI